MARSRVVHHVCPYLCCHLAHVPDRCSLERCAAEPCDGPTCWWHERSVDMPPGVGHISEKWMRVHRDGSVPVP